MTPLHELTYIACMNSPAYFYKTIPSPVGELKLVASQKGLAAILWENDKPNRVKLDPQNLDETHPKLLAAEKQLKEYFLGKRKQFHLELDFKGTEFQKSVWNELLKIPYGTVKTYSDIAKSIGRPKSTRAVGAANGKNPISIIAPCHRVIGINGSLTGFAGGLKAKEFLLKLES